MGGFRLATANAGLYFENEYLLVGDLLVVAMCSQVLNQNTGVFGSVLAVAQGTRVLELPSSIVHTGAASVSSSKGLSATKGRAPLLETN